MEQEKIIDPQTIGEIELPRFKLKPFIGKEVKISDTKVLKGNYGYYLKIETEPVDMIEVGQNKKFLRASKVFGLFQDEAGKIGWGKETKLGKYLIKEDAKHFTELIGKTVTVQIETSKDGEKEFLTFT